jgi:hypothetical protein
VAVPLLGQHGYVCGQLRRIGFVSALETEILLFDGG